MSENCTMDRALPNLIEVVRGTGHLNFCHKLLVMLQFSAEVNLNVEYNRPPFAVVIYFMETWKLLGDG